MPAFLQEKTQRERFLISIKNLKKKERKKENPKGRSCAVLLAGFQTKGQSDAFSSHAFTWCSQEPETWGPIAVLTAQKAFLDLLNKVVYSPFFFLTMDSFLPIHHGLFSGYVRFADFCLSRFSVLHIFYYSR